MFHLDDVTLDTKQIVARREILQYMSREVTIVQAEMKARLFRKEGSQPEAEALLVKKRSQSGKTGGRGFWGGRQSRQGRGRGGALYPGPTHVLAAQQGRASGVQGTPRGRKRPECSNGIRDRYLLGSKETGYEGWISTTRRETSDRTLLRSSHSPGRKKRLHTA
jgi:hypothetical protein